MFLISLSYKKPLKEVEKYPDAHSHFMEKHYALNKFIFSGRKNPRTGGVILAYNVTRPEVEEIIARDPFHQNGIADYEIMEVIPTKYDRQFEPFIALE